MAAAAVLAALLNTVPALAGTLRGDVRASDGSAVVGALVTVEQGRPAHGITVFTDHTGAFHFDKLDRGDWRLRVRRIGWRDHAEPATVPAATPLAIELTRETDPAAVAAQLPANRWFGLLLAEIEDDAQREEFVRQCTYCHQQGSRATRVPREDWQWQKILSLMSRMGGTLSPEVRAQVPTWFGRAYAPEHAVPLLTRGMDEPDFAPPPPVEVRRAVIEEWELGGRASMQHDLAVHPDGSVYSVDMMQDALFRLDPETGVSKSFPVPDDGLPLGGVFGSGPSPLVPNANAHQGPHSLQIAPDGTIWITLALGNRLGRFDPKTEQWQTFVMEEGFYPHTLRIDRRGRIWFTIAVSNHLGIFDPATSEFTYVRLPSGSIGQAIAVRLLPAMMWLSQNFGLDLSPGGEGGTSLTLPVPYGIDIAPDGIVWFSQLNEHRIGRIDPDTLEVEMIDTPFSAPRRLRFDSKGGLWIPGFSSGVVSRFDTQSRDFQVWELPIEPRGSETPYALHVDRRSDQVWICGTNSDSLWRFDPITERFTMYPLPTRVSYTREIDFDAQGRVWTSNSNMPTWQVERGWPRVIRLDPRIATRVAATQ
jgi:streptogramin lyase